MINWLINSVQTIPGALEVIVLIGAAVATVVTLKKTVVNPLRRQFNRVNAGMDTLLGYDAVTDPATGREIQPPTPPLATRVYDLELNNAKIGDALQTIADNQKQLVEIQAVMDERKAQGETIIAEWVAWRQSHEDEAQAREDRIAEWEVWRQEQTILMEAIKNQHELPHKTD